MPAGERSRRGAAGFTYVGLLVLVALIGLALSAAGEVVATAAQRDREAQLLWVGTQYRDAIGSYWRQRRAFPRELADLLGTAEGPLPARHLRRLYPDPMTNAVDWVLVQAPDGGVMGIASSSKRAPLKVAGFEPADRAFADANTYGDWRFTFQAAVLRRPPPPAGRR